MEKKSTQKLLAAGYIFLRTEDSTVTRNAAGVKYIIKECRDFGTWRKLEELPSKAARTRRIEELLAKGTPYIMEG